MATVEGPHAPAKRGANVLDEVSAGRGTNVCATHSSTSISGTTWAANTFLRPSSLVAGAAITDREPADVVAHPQKCPMWPTPAESIQVNRGRAWNAEGRCSRTGPTCIFVGGGSEI